MRKHTRRKVWHPGGNPVALAMRQNPLTDAELCALRLIEADALASLAAGTARAHQVRELSGRLLAGLILAADGTGPEALGPLRAGREALARATPAPQGFGLSGADLGTVADALEWLDAQRTATSAAQYERAMVKAIHQGKAAGLF